MKEHKSKKKSKKAKKLKKSVPTQILAVKDEKAQEAKSYFNRADKPTEFTKKFHVAQVHEGADDENFEYFWKKENQNYLLFKIQNVI